jgi:hypothetical protein
VQFHHDVSFYLFCPECFGLSEFVDWCLLSFWKNNNIFS